MAASRRWGLSSGLAGSKVALLFFLLLLGQAFAQPSSAPVVSTNPPVTEAPITLAPETPAPVMSTAAPVTNPPVTTAPVITNPPVTAAPVTSAPVTAAPVTSAPATSAPVITTTAPVITNPPITAAPVVTSAPTTLAPAVTSAPLTSAPVTLTPTLTPTSTTRAPVISTAAPTPRATTLSGVPTTILSPPAATTPAATPGTTARSPSSTATPVTTTRSPSSTLTPVATVPAPTNASGNPIVTPPTSTSTSTPLAGTTASNGATSANITSDPTTSSSKKTSVPGWVIPVAIVGGVVVLGLLGLALCIACCLNRKKKRTSAYDPSAGWKEDGISNGRTPVLPLYETGGGYKTSQASNRTPPARQPSSNDQIYPTSGGTARTASSNGRSTGTASSAASGRVRPFSLQELKHATDNFDPAFKLGAGGFGTVYRGVLPNGKEVAVKRSGHGQKDYYQFKNEVELLSRLHHRHLVGLLGFCDEDGEQILVYEFMANGAIAEHLKAEKVPLSWQSRLMIALGAARGLDYLHNWADPPIVHRDVKSDNILLDTEFNAKVADFGLSRLPPTMDTSTQSGIKGTFGYIDPNYAAGQPLTKKSDVYSFGVVLLQLVSGRLAVDLTRPQAEWSVVEWAKPYIHEGRFAPLVDPRMGDYSAEQLAVLVALIGRMVSKQASVRPKMADVVRTLEQLAVTSETATFDSTAFGDLQDDSEPLDLSQFKYNSSTQGSGFGSSGYSEASSSGRTNPISGRTNPSSVRTNRVMSGVRDGNPRSSGGVSRASYATRGGEQRVNSFGSDMTRPVSGESGLEQRPSTMFTRLQESRLHEGR